MDKLIRAKRDEQQLAMLKDISLAMLSNPIAVGLAGLAVNQLVYKAGFYDGTDAEAKITGALGLPEPIWFTIGRPPSTEDSKAAIAATRANTVSAFIIAGCTAWSASKMHFDIGSVAQIAGALK